MSTDAAPQAPVDADETSVLPAPDVASALGAGSTVAGGAAVPTPPVPAVPVAPAQPTVRLPRWVAWLAGFCAVALIPWIAYLAAVLPRHARAAHYDVAWVGFDVGMFAALLCLAVSAAHRSPATGPFAAVTATMLFTDAWFDVITSASRSGLLMAALSAVLVELPLGALCVWVSINAERLRNRAYERLWAHAEYARLIALRQSARERLERRWDRRLRG